MIRDYYELAKPGIIYGNAITVIAGFLLASRGNFHLWLFVVTLVGISLVIGSGCVFNNYIERDADRAMERTKDRALVAGRISGRAALTYGTALGIVGFLMLAVYANFLAVAVAALGFFFYVFMYSLWFKHRTEWGTVVGSVAGAVPPVVGYVAASGRLDAAALILFLIMITWQMPHFFAIAIRRADEYAAAKIPVLPVARGVRATKIQMLLYIVAFVIVAPLLTVFGYAGRAYLAIALVLGFAWLGFCLKGFQILDVDADASRAQDAAWARRMFLFSLVVMVVLFAAIAIGGALS